jgi:MoxR-like ATPase
LADGFGRVADNIETVVEGKPEVVRLALISLLSEGHLLLEDVPGVGKTLLAKAIGRSISCSVRRIQFTPDLLPSDVTGTTVYNESQRDFEFKPGAVFANIVVGDEINRAGPKTQSALLEAMQERTVTVDGSTHVLAVPFMVIATQNPIELEGTYPLPEAQRDRFMMRLSIGYPSLEAELAMLTVHGAGDRLDTLNAVTDVSEIAGWIEAVKMVHASEAVQTYVLELVRATRLHPDLELGASPRASLALLRAARAQASTGGRDFVTADDIKQLLQPVLSHRLILSPDAQMNGRGASDVLGEISERVPVPRGSVRS